MLRLTEQQQALADRLDRNAAVSGLGLPEAVMVMAYVAAKWEYRLEEAIQETAAEHAQAECDPAEAWKEGGAD